VTSLYGYVETEQAVQTDSTTDHEEYTMNIKSAAAGAALALAAAGMFAGVATQVQTADAPIHC